MEPRLFALDQNFPEPIVVAIAKAVPLVDLVSVRAINPRLAEVDDWELLLALHQDERPWDGLITNDDAMLSLPREVTILSQTCLTLVVAQGEGHNPIRAAGVLLCHLNFICHHTRPDRAQIWSLRVTQKNAEEPTTYLERIALRERTTSSDLFKRHKLSAQELLGGRKRT